MPNDIISGNYRELHDPMEIQRIASECQNSWKHVDIPRRQYELAVHDELEKLKAGISNRTYDALIECMRKLPMRILVSNPQILDVGASSGYYSEVLKRLMGFRFRYLGVDYSQNFQRVARELYPGIAFDVEDACYLPYHDDSCDVVLHSACIMHIYHYRKAIHEAARVSNEFVIFHRTPVTLTKPTSYWTKQAYGIDVMEILFNEAELLKIFDASGLKLLHTAEIFWNGTEGHRCYLLTKGEHERHVAV